MAAGNDLTDEREGALLSSTLAPAGAAAPGPQQLVQSPTPFARDVPLQTHITTEESSPNSTCYSVAKGSAATNIIC